MRSAVRMKQSVVYRSDDVELKGMHLR